MQFTIIQQNDTHRCVEAHNELFWETDGPLVKKTGGSILLSLFFCLY